MLDQRTVLLSQFCPSVHPSVFRYVYCDKTRRWTADIFIPHETAITLVFRYQHWLVGDALFHVKYSPKMAHPFEKRRLRPISSYNVSTVRDSEKSSIITNIKWPRAFQRAIFLRTLPLSPEMVAQKAFFVFWNKSQLQSNKVCYKVSLCENFQQQSCSRSFPYLTVYRYWCEK